MSARAGRNSNRIRGPQSALTDFLAANNISAQQIRDTYEQRNRSAQEQNDAESAAVAAAVNELLDEDSEEEEIQRSRPSASKKRKRATENEKSKSKKKSKKGKGKKKHDDDDDADSDAFDPDSDDNPLGRAMYRKSKPNPGQLEYCELCDARFTVTAYSKTGPEGGLVCTPCGKDMAKTENTAKKKPKKSTSGKGRRTTESNRLDGIVSAGPKSLQQLCLEKVADHHLDIEEFGELQEDVLNRLSEIFSKRRVMDSRTVDLFLRPDLDTVAIHDAAGKFLIQRFNIRNRC